MQSPSGRAHMGAGQPRAASDTSSPPTLARLGGESMGTSWTVLMNCHPSCDLHQLHSLVQQRLDRVVEQMSHWEPDSNISRFNGASAGSWHALPAELETVLRCALDVAKRSHGAFDPCLGALVQAWGFGPSPSAGGIGRSVPGASVRPWQRLALQSSPSRVLQPGGVVLDLSAIAKGYAVDEVVGQLRSTGIEGALVDVGGELSGFGRKPDGSAWQVLVEGAPDEEEASALPPRVLRLDGVAVATSGDRWHHFEHSGRRHSHTLDPGSGAPVHEALAAVTVVAPSAMLADAWATALSVMGSERGLAHAQATGLAARFLVRDRGMLLESMNEAFVGHLAS